MPRFRRSLPPINSTKHYNQHSVFSVAAAAITRRQDVLSVSLPNVTNAQDVRSGAVVKAIFMEFWIHSGNDISAATFTISVEKTKGGQPAMTFAQSIGLMSYPNKANVLYVTQGIIGAGNTTNPVSIIRQWVAIPKGKQRFALGDSLAINFSSISVGISVCGFTVYKEYY